MDAVCAKEGQKDGAEVVRPTVMPLAQKRRGEGPWPTPGPTISSEGQMGGRWRRPGRAWGTPISWSTGGSPSVQACKRGLGRRWEDCAEENNLCAVKGTDKLT